MRSLDRFAALREKEDRLVVGLSSGTSADGIDAVLLSVRGNGISTRVRLVAGRTYPYEPGIRDAVLRLGESTASDVCRMNFLLGEFFGRAAVSLVHETGYKREDIDLIGSHGQTIYHVPGRTRRKPSTLQIGEPDVIAEMTRAPVVADFRTRDVAAGGDGAPLVPYVDFLLFRPEEGAVALQNIGGIANVSLVRPDLQDLVAFDTGPGNMPLDQVVRVLTRGRETCDRGGKIASRGRIDQGLVERLLEHPYFAKEPPKTTGREDFGERYVMGILDGKGNLSLADILASLTLFVARSIHRAYEEFLFSQASVREILVSGGGLGNLALMAHLRRLFHPIPVLSVSERGMDAEMKEAVAFAVLANETLFGNPNNVPTATGAKWPVVLGKISL